MKTFFFGLHLICSPEQNGGQGSSLPMVKIEQNWGKIANYPPQCSKKIGTPGSNSLQKNMLENFCIVDGNLDSADLDIQKCERKADTL